MKAKKIIVAIGGGEVGRIKLFPDGVIKEFPIETLEIDKEIVRLSGKEKPRLLYIGTASNDSLLGTCAMKRYFGNILGCEVFWLPLVADNLSKEEIENMIMNSDIIYVGGGNTRQMLKIWREKEVDVLLKKAWEKGVILSGLSAGANCWFEHASTDSTAIELGATSGTHLCVIDCLGFVKGICVPHTLSEPLRMPNIKEELKENYSNTCAYAIDDYAALVIEDGKMRSIVSGVGLEKGSKVRKIFVKNDEIKEDII